MDYRPLGGAVAALALAFAYAVVFIVYAIIRTSLLVISANPDAGIPGTIVAYAATLSLPALVICALMAIPAALVGLFTAALLKPLLRAWNPQYEETRAAVIGAAVCGGMVVLLHAIFQQVLGFSLADVAANSETYLFWLAIPSLIYVAAGAVAGRALNQRLRDEVAAYRLPHGTGYGRVR